MSRVSMKVHHDCTFAPPGSVLVQTGNGSGGKGRQFFFRKGAPGSKEELHSQALPDLYSARWWVEEGIIKFDKPNHGGRTPKRKEKR